jgi:hypothetical protein
MSAQFENNAESLSELISLFVDGEDVDAGLLGKALVRPGGRETLLDFLALREHIHKELDFQPSADFYENMEQRLISTKRPTANRKFRTIAVAILSLVLGIAIGWGVGLGAKTSDPPSPSRTIRFEPGTDWYAYAGERSSGTGEEPR